MKGEVEAWRPSLKYDHFRMEEKGDRTIVIRTDRDRGSKKYIRVYARTRVNELKKVVKTPNLSSHGLMFFINTYDCVRIHFGRGIG